MILDWLRSRCNAAPAAPPPMPEFVDLTCRHVREQVFAFTGRHVESVPSYSSMTDLLIGSYIWGLLEGCVGDLRGGRGCRGGGNIAPAAAEACLRLLGSERARWVRSQLPQWEGPPAYHPPYRRELSRMRSHGIRDGGYLAAGDRLCFARAGSLLSVLMRTWSRSDDGHGPA
ncbi:hypothetical protein [Microvirga tunisiensis]|uniref:hypothetical protein n=1 Tax=Microvirga tunisiensis TaxID=2108360 RepID=UPI00128B7D16|nr:hypothetical protein [Microvirga tunisiensis]MPR11180.1 hypothetical protein [Microvirga tunisiensis]